MLISAYEVCLERVAEELMGRRKWKQYQEALTRSHINADQITTNIDQLEISSQKQKEEETNSLPHQQQPFHENLHQHKQHHHPHRIKENDVIPKIKTEIEVEAEGTDVKALVLHIKKENCVDTTAGDTTIIQLNNNSTSHNHSSSNSGRSSSAAATDTAAKDVTTTISATSPPAVPTSATDTTTTTVVPSFPPPPHSDTDAEEPFDWKPNEKCYFCVDGKLLTVNAKGELVAESSPALSEADHAHRQAIIESESDSSDSCLPESASSSSRVNVNKILTSRLRDSNMTSMESMAARLAAIHSIQGQLYPNLWYNQLAQQANSATPTTSETSAAAVSPSLKDSPSPSDATGEQPLDLSSKPSPNSSAGGDLKHSYRAKPRITAVTGRRTYSEEELQSALQDIMSGKLGTRRAAVQYNIPRSTLRNKVYKMSMEAKRETPTSALLQLHHDLDMDVGDNKDLSGDDGEEDSSGDKCLSGISLTSFPHHLPQQHHHQHHHHQHQHQGIDNLASRIAASANIQKIHKICENNGGDGVTDATATAATTASLSANLPPKAIASLEVQPKRKTSTPATQLPAQAAPQMAPIWIDPNVLLQSLLLSGGLGQLTQNHNPQQNPLQIDEALPLRELFSCLLMSSGCTSKDALAAALATAASSEARGASVGVGDVLNNGKPNMIDPRILLQQLPLLQQSQSHHQHQQQQQTQQHHHQQLGGHSFQNRLPKSETSSVDLNEASDDPSVILKIPSYKPVAGSSSSAGVALSSTVSGAATPTSPSLQVAGNNKNGDTHHPQTATSPRIPTSILAAAVAAGSGTNSTQQHQQQQQQQHSASSALFHQVNNIPGISPPLIRHTTSALSGDSQSPPTLSLRDVIANSIHRTMNQQANKDAQAAAVAAAVAAESDRNDQYKKPSISVIKNIGGTDTTRFAAAPNVLHNSHHSMHSHHSPSPSSSHAHSHHSHSHHSQNSANNSLAGGKGTRPKRGKYRNYDRDSLVEAVKAVQRGEMSVHRAGSYYGVPHSTLEYKVKERHLMRPRKREPKPQPLDDRTGGVSSAAGVGSSSKNNSNIPGLSAVNSLDKLKSSSLSSVVVAGAAGTTPPAGVLGTSASISQKQSSAHKNSNNPPSSAFPNTSPNGMKMPIFDPAVAAAQLQYAPHLFWSHPAAAAAAAASGFGQLQIDYNRTSQSAGAELTAGAGAAAFVNAETFLKSQMIQRFHEESMRASGSSSGVNAANSPSPIASPLPSNHLSGKSAREIAENLYDTGGANGSSLLDGIIRKTLDRKSTDITTHGALLDQLMVNNRPPYNHHTSGGGHTNDQQMALMNSSSSSSTSASSLIPNMKRSATPSDYPAVDIKRERSSPVNTDDASSSDAEDSDPNNGSSALHSHRRSRNISRDSDTDSSAQNSSEHLHPSHQHHHQHHHQQQLQQQLNNQLQQQHHQHLQAHHTTSMNSSLVLREDLNGGGYTNSAGVGSSHAAASIPSMDISSAPSGAVSNISTILQEKLGRIKSENDESL